MEKIIQITSGRGPLECQWVVGKVLKAFLDEAKQNTIDYEIIHRENGDENLTLKSATLLLKGKMFRNSLPAGWEVSAGRVKALLENFIKEATGSSVFLKLKTLQKYISMKKIFSFKPQEAKEAEARMSIK